MKSEKEEELAHKPKLVRAIIESILSVIIIFIIICLSQRKIAFENFIVSLLFFSFAYINNIYFLKPALQNGLWKRFALKFTLLMLLIFPAFFISLQLLENDSKPLSTSHEVFVTYINLIILGLIVFFIGGAAYLIKYFTFERQLRLQAELALKTKQLLLLQSQVNPHFLFNALNSIKALTSIDPDKAREAIVQLSELLRKSLNILENNVTKISDELITVNEYLWLEKLRYGDRIQLEIDYDPKVGDFFIPAMSLQLMVENSIKHGISKLMDGGTIKINIYKNEKSVFLEVRNTGKINEEKIRNGIGTQLIKENLSHLYKNTASFNLSNEDSNTVLAQLTLPINF